MAPAIRLWPTLVIALVALWLPFANYGSGGELIGGDASAAWAYPSELLRQLAGVFVDYQALGQNAAEGIQAIFPTLTLAALLHVVGFSTAVAARLMIALYYFVAMSGAQCVGGLLLRGEVPWVRRLAALSGALLFGINHYTLHVFGTVETYFPLGYIAMPWLLYGVLEASEGNRRIGIAAIVAAIVCAGGAAMNPAFFGVALLVLPLGAALAIGGGARPLPVLATTGTGLLLGIGVCAWWVLPAPTGFGASLGQLAAEGASWVQWMSQHSGFAQLFRLDGYVGSPDLPFAAWYASPLGALLGFGPLLVAVAGAGVVRRRLDALALIAFAVLVFLAKGVHAPFGSVYQAFMDHVPGFSIFRSPYDKWAQLEALVLIVAYVLGFAGVVRRVRAWRPTSRALVAAVAVCAVLPVVAYPWPAYVGRMLQSSADPVVTFTPAIPGDYRVTGDFLRRNVGAARALVLNAGGLPYPLYSWGYFGQDPLAVVAGVPVSGADAIPRAAYLSTRALERALDALAVRYVVVHDDLRNAQPGADVHALVDDHDARLVLRTKALRVYERPHAPASLVGLVHDGALIAAGTNGPSAVDPLQTAQVVPNLAPALAAPGATALSARYQQPGDAALGRIAGLAVPATPPRGDGIAALLGNPLTAVVAAGRCGRREALHVRSPSTWALGGATLPALERTFCLRFPHVGPVFVDGVPAQGPAGIVSFPHRERHRLVVTEAAARARIIARPVPGEDLVFQFIAPFAGNRVELPAPVPPAGGLLVAEIFTSDDATIGSGFDGAGAASFVIPAVGRQPVAGERCFIDFHDSDERLWPALRRLRAIPLTLEMTSSETFAFRAGAELLDAHALVAGDVRGPLREHGTGVELAAARTPRLEWDNSRTAPRSEWTTQFNTLDLIEPVGGEVQAAGNLLVTDRYALNVSYRATGDAALTFALDGYAAPLALGLVADGQTHTLSSAIVPPTASSGAFMLTASAPHGTLHLNGASLTDAGPNALVYAMRAAHTGGALVRANRPNAWRFDATLRDCTPCTLRIAVSEPQHWSVHGARVLGTYEGAGQSTGMPWSGNTTGAATWVLDAGPGVHDVTAVFYPAELAAIGLVIALVALAVTVVVLRRLAPGSVVELAPALLDASRRTGALRAAAFVLALVVAPAAAAPALADAAGLALCVLLALLGCSLFADGAPRAQSSTARVSVMR